MPPVMRMGAAIRRLIVARFPGPLSRSMPLGDSMQYARRIMFREIRVGVLALLAFGALVGTRDARAQERAPTPLVVLPLTTDDADDQADALTRALRARVEALPAWALQESAQSFETLSIALRCPTKPDAACLERVADQIHTDHYVWGTMVHGRGDVTADVNLWSRDGADAEATATFPDNLKDSESPKLRGVAVRLLESLLGAPAEAPVVHAKPATAPAPAPAAVEPAAPEPSSPARPSQLPKILGYAGVTAGAVLLVAGGIGIAKWASDKSTADQDRAMVPATVSDVCVAPGNLAAAAACQASTRELNDAVFAWAFTIAGAAVVGTGVWLLLASGGSDDAKSTAFRLPIEVVPTIGSRAGSLDVKLRF